LLSFFGGTFPVFNFSKTKHKQKDARLEDGSKKVVALKELKLQGNEQNEDVSLEVQAVCDAIIDCGFPSVAETIRLAASLLRQPKT
jgi:hypothetical protein